MFIKLRVVATTFALAASFISLSACGAAAIKKDGQASSKKADQASLKKEAVSTEVVKAQSSRGDPVAGKGKSELCQGCHGEEGISLDGMTPKLAGQNGTYIAKQLRNYQSGIRTHQIMSEIAPTVNDADLDDIAAYFENSKKMQGNGSTNKLGKNLYLQGDMSRMIVACVNCHGVNGEGKTNATSIFPVIGGQHKEYLLGQFNSFRNGERQNSPGGVMNIMLQRLTDAELEALADYVAGL